MLYVLLAFDLPLSDIRCIGKPYGPILILRKLSPHLQYLRLMHLLHVVAHLVALDHAILVVLPVLNHFDLIPEPLEVIGYLSLRVVMIQGCVELDHNGCAAAYPGFDIGLNVDNTLPVLVCCTFLKDRHEPMVRDDAQDTVLVPVEILFLIFF